MEKEPTGKKEKSGKPKRHEDQGVRLKPIVYATSTYKRGAPNKIQQLMLLKALQVTSDPKELRRMIGVKTVADVYRTLDKLALRREYHKALEKNGVSFDYIVQGLKKVVDSAEKDSDKVNAIKTLLKSVGMDKYEGDAAGAAGSWEDALIKAADEKRQEVGDGVDMVKLLEEDYEVDRPEVPDYIQKMQEDEAEMGKSLYED